MDKYRPTKETRKQILLSQIDEAQRIVYRNDLENLTFKANNDKYKQTEVNTNNEILSEKLDLLFAELDKLETE